MVLVLIICLTSCIGMIALTLIKPKLTIINISLSTYWMATLIGAVLLVSFNRISVKEVFEGLTSQAAINPLKILILFVSMTIISVFLDETGFFKYLANVVLKRTNSGQFKLFTAFYITISVITIFTSNDIIILTFTPFICYFAKNAKVNPLPYLISEFIAANTCGMLLIVGNPTNIYLATASGIDFMAHLKTMALPTLFAAVSAYTVMILLFRKQLKTPLTGTTEDVKIEDKPLLIVGITVLALCTVLLAVSSYIKFEMWLIAFLSCAGLILIVLSICLLKRKLPSELGRAIKRAPWELIPFVISMFVMVLALEKYGISNRIAEFLGEKNTIFTYGFMSVIFANLINNIPMSVLFASILQNLNPVLITQGIYAVIVGSNISAFLTPIGALAGIMWLQILRDNDIQFSFLKFLKFGIIIAIPTLLAALCGLLIVL